MSANNITMTEAEAAAWVRSHGDDDQLDEQQLEAAFRAIFERDADDDDRAEGLWSHLCAAVEVQERIEDRLHEMDVFTR